MPRIVFYEDRKAEQFDPIALLRPVFELRCGHFSTRERLVNPGDEWGVVLRPELTETYREAFPDCRINDVEWLRSGPTVFINGRCLLDGVDLPPGSAAWIDGELAAIRIDQGDELPDQLGEIPEALAALASNQQRTEIPGVLLRYPWDLVEQNPHWLTRDFQRRQRGRGLAQLDSRVAIVGSAEDVWIDESARLDPFVVIDATNGPVWIDEQVRVQAFTRIEGPAYIGPRTQLFRANLREGCSIGPECRIGGEVEESIFHGYSNKYHDGFLGHSYVCPWVNLGALTTNSDLKNDYSEVSVPLRGVSIKTCTTKVGSFIGDHTKTALCSLFNTGSSVGVMSLILPGGELLPKHLPSFSRIWHGRIEELPDGCESGIETAKQAMARRGQSLTPAMERLIRHVHGATLEERERAIQRRTT